MLPEQPQLLKSVAVDENIRFSKQYHIIKHPVHIPVLNTTTPFRDKVPGFHVTFVGSLFTTHTGNAVKKKDDM